MGDAITVLGVGGFAGSLLIAIVMYLLNRSTATTLNGEGTGNRWASKITDQLADIKALSSRSESKVTAMHRWMEPNEMDVQVWRSPDTLTTLHKIADTMATVARNQEHLIESVEKDQKELIEELRALRTAIENRG